MTLIKWEGLGYQAFVLNSLYCFPNSILSQITHSLLSGGEGSRQLIRLLVKEYLYYEDVKFYLLQNIK